MTGFIRNNPLIVASVALPLALIVVFALAGIVPRMLVDPPQYDLLLTQFDPSADRQASFSVEVVAEDEAAVVRLSSLDHPAARGRLRVFLYDQTAGALVELGIDWPDDRDSLESGDRLPIPALAGRRISPSRRAPDGWEYRGSERRGGLFFGFFGGRYRERVTIVRDGAVLPIELPETSYYGIGEVRFVGWVIDP